MGESRSQIITPIRAFTASATVFTLLGVASFYMLFNSASSNTVDASIANAFTAPGQINTDMTAFVERPLFSNTRRSSVKKTPKSSTTAGLLVPKGTSITNRRRSVVMAGPDGPIIMHEGDERDGVTVVRIGPTSVELEKNGKRRIVPLGS